MSNAASNRTRVRAARFWVAVGRLATIGILTLCVFSWWEGRMTWWFALFAAIGGLAAGLNLLIGIALLVASGAWQGGLYLVMALLSTYGFAVGKDLNHALATGIDPDTGAPFELD
jgi:hypothetical protein